MISFTKFGIPLALFTFANSIACSAGNGADAGEPNPASGIATNSGASSSSLRAGEKSSTLKGVDDPTKDEDNVLSVGDYMVNKDLTTPYLMTLTAGCQLKITRSVQIVRYTFTEKWVSNGKEDHEIWRSSHEFYDGDCKAFIQKDGNFVVQANKQVVYQSKKISPGATLQFQSNGILQVVATDGTVLWSSAQRSTGGNSGEAPFGRCVLTNTGDKTPHLCQYLDNSLGPYTFSYDQWNSGQLINTDQKVPSGNAVMIPQL